MRSQHAYNVVYVFSPICFVGIPDLFMVLYLFANTFVQTRVTHLMMCMSFNSNTRCAISDREMLTFLIHLSTQPVLTGFVFHDLWFSMTCFVDHLLSLCTFSLFLFCCLSFHLRLLNTSFCIFNPFLRLSS